MNKCIFIGRLVKEPDIRYAQNQNSTCVAKFSIAVDRKFKQKEGDPTADFINCVAFGKLGELVEKYVTKGSKVNIVGRLQTGNYTNKEGQKVYTNDIVVEEIEFLDNKTKSEGGSQQENRPAPANGDGFMNIPDGIDEELPFN